MIVLPEATAWDPVDSSAEGGRYSINAFARFVEQLFPNTWYGNKNEDGYTVNENRSIHDLYRTRAAMIHSEAFINWKAQ